MIDTANGNSTVTVVAKRSDGSIQHYCFESDGGVFVGKSTNCGLRLQGEGLSEIHCRVELDDGDVWVQDWMSKQGTMIDGTVIDSKVLLEQGAVLSIGEYSITIRTGEVAIATEQAEDSSRQEAASPERAETTEQPESLEPVEQTEPLRHVDPISQDTLVESAAPFEHDEQPDAVPPPVEHDEPQTSASVPPVAPFDEEPISFDYDAEFFEEETYDRETVELLRAEIIDLQAALAERDAQAHHDQNSPSVSTDPVETSDQSDALLGRMQELLDEAQRSDERVALLEEMLHTSEEASRNEQEERTQLEGWLGEIERRIGQREEEHAAEVDALKRRVEETTAQRDEMQQKFQRAASCGAAPQQYEETLETLQRQNRELQQRVDEYAKQHAVLTKQLENSQLHQEDALREERAEIAQERAKISRLRYELSNRLTGIEELPKTENEVDRETSLRLRTLRQHLREIHEEEKREAKQASLATRVKKLWNRVEY